MSIGELAMETGVKIVTIRYYEQIGVLPALCEPPPITAPTARNTRNGSALYAGAEI